MGHGLRLVTDGTENHLMLMDLGADGPSGRAMQSRLEKASITANKNTVPRETRKATVTSGIRLGTPALTTRGMGPDEMRRIAGWIRRVHDAGRGNEEEFARVRHDVEDLARGYPVPGIVLPA
jgi:glycine hydroxymethyltransferase